MVVRLASLANQHIKKSQDPKRTTDSDKERSSQILAFKLQLQFCSLKLYGLSLLTLLIGISRTRESHYSIVPTLYYKSLCLSR